MPGVKVPGVKESIGEYTIVIDKAYFRKVRSEPYIGFYVVGTIESPESKAGKKIRLLYSKIPIEEGG